MFLPNMPKIHSDAYMYIFILSEFKILEFYKSDNVYRMCKFSQYNTISQLAFNLCITLFLQNLTESVIVCCLSFSMVLIKSHIDLLNGIDTYIIENAKWILPLFCFSRSCQQVDLSEMNFVTIMFGVCGWITRLAGRLFEQIARDGVILSAMILGKSANSFHFKGRVTNSSPTEANTIGAEILSEYNWIKKISKHVNSAFNIVFRFFLLANVFMFAVFVDEWFNPEIGKVTKMLKLANVVLTCITFYYANQTAKIVSKTNN
ncbi:unnamed protein product [Orchesella dallaii]|uniref:Uncharacterized protein n=1 Tax=Orchesella dallaii TaxID=48710 RepID=A0ABP1PKA4_9HEXA